MTMQNYIRNPGGGLPGNDIRIPVIQPPPPAAPPLAAGPQYDKRGRQVVDGKIRDNEGRWVYPNDPAPNYGKFQNYSIPEITQMVLENPQLAKTVPADVWLDVPDTFFFEHWNDFASLLLVPLRQMRRQISS